MGMPGAQPWGKRGGDDKRRAIKGGGGEMPSGGGRPVKGQFGGGGGGPVKGQPNSDYFEDYMEQTGGPGGTPPFVPPGQGGGDVAQSLGSILQQGQMGGEVPPGTTEQGDESYTPWGSVGPNSYAQGYNQRKAYSRQY